MMVSAQLVLKTARTATGVGGVRGISFQLVLLLLLLFSESGGRTVT